MIIKYKDFLFEWGYGGEGGIPSKDPIKLKDRMFVDIEINDENQDDDDDDDDDKDISILKNIKVLNENNDNDSIDPYKEENWDEKIPEKHYLKWKDKGGNIYSFLKQLNNEYINYCLDRLSFIKIKQFYSILDEILLTLSEVENFSNKELSHIEKDIMNLKELFQDNYDDIDTDKYYGFWKKNDDYIEL